MTSLGSPQGREGPVFSTILAPSTTTTYTSNSTEITRSSVTAAQAVFFHSFVCAYGGKVNVYFDIQSDTSKSHSVLIVPASILGTKALLTDLSTALSTLCSKQSIHFGTVYTAQSLANVPVDAGVEYVIVVVPSASGSTLKIKNVSIKATTSSRTVPSTGEYSSTAGR